MHRTCTIFITAFVALSTLVPQTFAVQILPPDLGITDSFATMEEAEVACRKALGLGPDEQGSLLFYVRRCVSTLWKREQNKLIGERKTERRMRMHSRLVDKAQQAIEQAKTGTLGSGQIKEKIRQQQTTDQERIEQFIELRSHRRVRIRTEEHHVLSKQEERLKAQKEAQSLCKDFTGTQRMMCIREKTRAMLETPSE